MKLHDAELRVMDVLWKEGEASASHIAEVLAAKYEYSKTTTYTLIKRCIDKSAIARQDPGFLCSALISQAQVQEMETSELIDKLYDGAADMLVASVLGSGRLSKEEVERLRRMVEEWSDMD